ncbi:MAG TPA: hypothetical protein VJ783_09415 [Pirellulales bacterium]|nr:hypothetical protein [Pirellulales bacterium]
MKGLLAVVVVLVVLLAASSAHAQVVAAWYPAPAVIGPAPVVVAPPVPVVGYYATPVVRFTPGYVFGAAPLAPLPRVYGYRERYRVRGPFYRSTVRVRGW